MREELLAFVGPDRMMPSTRELDSEGRSDLRAAITAHGGTARWARELGLELTARQVRSRRDEELLLAVARGFAARGYLPGANKLRELGHDGLAVLVLRAGGSRRFCAAHGLPYVDGRTTVARAPR